MKLPAAVFAFERSTKNESDEVVLNLHKRSCLEVPKHNANVRKGFEIDNMPNLFV